MEKHDYQAFTEQLVAVVRSDPRMIGLLALGSTADESRVDEWSDHDIWVVATSKFASEVRDDRSWLPDGNRIALWSIETKHGRSAIYDDGHLLEYAVFAPDELTVASANKYRVLVGGEDLESRMGEIAAETTARATERQSAEDITIGRLAVHLVIGLGRFGRGEHLSAHEHVKRHALFHLVGLLRRRVGSTEMALLDNLDPLRRFESVHPDLARRLDQALHLPILETVEVYLDMVEEHLPDVAGESFDPVQRLLDRVRDSDHDPLT